MDKEYVKSVAETILAQLNYVKTEVWAWGSKDFMFLERDVDGSILPALIFSIRTPKVPKNGKVIISYALGEDTYIVEAVTIKNGVETKIGMIKDVYFDNLHSTINSLIETKDTMTVIDF